VIYTCRYLSLACPPKPRVSAKVRQCPPPLGVAALRSAEESSRRALAAEMWSMRIENEKAVADLERDLSEERARHKLTRASLGQAIRTVATTTRTPRGKSM